MTFGTRFEDVPPVPSLSPEEVQEIAEAEGLTLVRSSGKTGFAKVLEKSRTPNKPGHAAPRRRRPYTAQINLRGRKHSLGDFATAEEAALAYSRHLGPEASAEEQAAFAALEAAAPTPAASDPLASLRLPVHARATHDGRCFSVTGLKHVGQHPNSSKFCVHVGNRRAGNRRTIATGFETAEAAGLWFLEHGHEYIDEPPAGSTSRKRRLELREPSDDDDDESEGEWEPSGEEDAVEEELPEVEVEAEDVVVDDDDDDTPVVYAEVVE